MLIQPHKQPLQTISYRPISLLSAIMKLFERVIEERLRKHLEDRGFFSKHESGFRKSKSTNDHPLCLSQIIMESFKQGEHVIAPFLDVKKAFDNVWHNGHRGTKSTSLICPPSLVGFPVSKRLPKSSRSTRFKPESITFSYLCQ